METDSETLYQSGWSMREQEGGGKVQLPAALLAADGYRQVAALEEENGESPNGDGELMKVDTVVVTSMFANTMPPEKGKSDLTGFDRLAASNA